MNARVWYLEENKELILAILEYQNLGKFAEIVQCQAKLQHNLTYLAKLADAGSQAPTPSQVSSHAIVQQGQGMRQPQVAMSQSQPDLSTFNVPIEMLSDQQQLQQHHLAMSIHQPDISASKLPLQMNEQNYKLPFFLYQQQPIPGPMVNFPGANSGLYQASQTRLGNLPDTPSSNQTGSDSFPGWS
ncbi:GRF1-interacting factor 2-like isoform X2 [Phaseolus vulgaris]|uniref:GRF1-interacting factor 2-like isoform X2 n=1 Tax=Phaseolus vulgaris TaxID=3885 RepID=UPI0035C9ECB5